METLLPTEIETETLLPTETETRRLVGSSTVSECSTRLHTLHIINKRLSFRLEPSDLEPRRKNPIFLIVRKKAEIVGRKPVFRFGPVAMPGMPTSFGKTPSLVEIQLIHASADESITSRFSLFYLFGPFLGF